MLPSELDAAVASYGAQEWSSNPAWLNPSWGSFDDFGQAMLVSQTASAPARPVPLVQAAVWPVASIPSPVCPAARPTALSLPFKLQCDSASSRADDLRIPMGPWLASGVIRHFHRRRVGGRHVRADGLDRGAVAARTQRLLPGRRLHAGVDGGGLLHGAQPVCGRHHRQLPAHQGRGRHRRAGAGDARPAAVDQRGAAGRLQEAAPAA
eukprot:scaffold7919_cov112-Isochrysis_galbana.AAC.1